MISIRRLALAIAPLAVLAPALSSCSSVSSDAITVNGESLSRTDFDEIVVGYAAGFPGSVLETGALNASMARGFLTDWATTQIYATRLEADGVAVTDEQIADAREGLARQAGFAEASEVAQNFYVYAAAVRTAFEERYGLTDAEIRDLYEAGPSSSKVYCLRGILTADEPRIGEAALRLATGEDFAAVAAEISSDPTKVNGGILQNPRTGGACLDEETLLGQVAPQFAEALASVGIDEPTAPFEIPDVGWVILILRPFDEVVDGIRDVIAQPGLAELRDELLRTADVSVGSQYGRWDATKGEVIPF